MSDNKENNRDDANILHKNKGSSFYGDEQKASSVKHNLSKFEYDLYHDEDNKIEKIIRVKKFSLPNKGERWKVFEDNKVVFIVEGSKLSKKEQEFLGSLDGFIFLITQYKLGIKSFNSLKNEIKKKIKGKSA